MLVGPAGVGAGRGNGTRGEHAMAHASEWHLGGLDHAQAFFWNLQDIAHCLALWGCSCGFGSS